MIGDLFLCHLIGDYLLQTHNMAVKKTSCSKTALIHAALYGIPFQIYLTYSFSADLIRNALCMVVIIVTHFFIDRYRLATWYIWLINGARGDKKDTVCGYPLGTPDWLAVWLSIIVDNTIHMLINALAFYALIL